MSFTTRELEAFARKGDVKSATRTHNTGWRYKIGQVWSFWMEDDPRADDGILPLGAYVCVQGGSDDALWEKR